MKRAEILNQIEQLMEQLADLDDGKEEEMSQPMLEGILAASSVRPPNIGDFS